MAGAREARLFLLGGFRLRQGDNDVSPQPGPRLQELLAFLILHAADAPLPRQRVAGALWPDSTGAQALTNLRRELHTLREQWPALERAVESGSRTLAWRASRTIVADVNAFDALADRGASGDPAALADAAQLYAGDLLPDCDAEWIEADRVRLRDRATAVLGALVDAHERSGADEQAIAAAQRLARIDPLREEAWRALMRVHARRGDRAAALQAFAQCSEVLQRELGVQPSAATRILHREVLDVELSAAAPRPRAAPATYPLVGRADEWRRLLRAWRDADRGRAGLVIIRGEAGIGKTRLAEELIEWCAGNRVRAVDARCYAGEGGLAYAPIAAWLKRDPMRPPLARLDGAALTDVARLHPEAIAGRADVTPPAGPLESWQRVRFFDALTRAFVSASPIVLVIDDLQWADADTLEWLQYFLRSAADARALVVATARADEEQDNLPLQRMLRHLAQDDRVIPIALGRLDRDATAQLAGAVAERALDDVTLARTFRDTEGHPLFIVERGRMALTAGVAGVDNALSRVQSVVAARLALLSPEARAVAEVAAAIGRDFTVDVLARASGLDESVLAGALDELWRRQIVRAHGDDRWDFSHDRIREVAYDGIGPARAPLVHRRIAQAMAQVFADRLDDVSAAIAMHWERGGQAAAAVPFLERAAAVATRLSANEEAIRCLSAALSLLTTLPEGNERDDRELALRARLSVVLNSARGYAAPDVEENLARVIALERRHGGEAPGRWLWAAFTLHYMLGDLAAASTVAEQALARSVADPSCRCEAHHAMGGVLSAMGELDASRRHFDAALAAYDEADPQQSALGSDLGVFAHGWYAHTLWLLGEEPAAVAHAEAAIGLARRRDHLYSQTLAFAYAGLLHQMRGDIDGVLACADTVVSLCDRHGFAYYGDWARVLIGWAQGRQRPAHGAAAIEAALDRLDAKRAQARRPYYLSLLADTHRAAGRRDRAAAVVDAAIEMALARSDLWWLPALYFQKSELEPPPARDDLLRRGLDLARTQGSRGLEQRILAAG
jgi:DNA-binding SARP family transcriptional activator